MSYSGPSNGVNMVISDDEMNEEEEKDLTKFQKARRGCKRKWEKFLFKPKDPFKIKWDIFVILLSIWNAI